MSTQNQSTPSAARDRQQRKPYQKPSFRSERVFEILALQCGKISNTQAQCVQVRKNS
jgi:hypothetical protein